MGSKSKIILILGILAGLLLLVGIGGFAAYQFFMNTPKNNYLLAEKDEIDYFMEVFEERFESELEWYEQTQTNAVEMGYTVTADVNDPSLNEMGLGQMINQSEVILQTQLDNENEYSSVDMSGNIAGVSFEDIFAYLDEDTAGITFPFIEEYIILNEADAATFINTMEPEAMEEDTEVDYSDFFTGSLSEENIEYIQDEYTSFIRQELPDDAFSSESEDITVGDDEISAEKLTMELSETQIQEFLSSLYTKIADDEELAEMIRMEFTMNAADMEGEKFISDFNEALREEAEEVHNREFPDGLTSTIWSDGDHIVKRELNGSFVDSGETVPIEIAGEKVVSDEGEQFNYTISSEGESVDMEAAFNETEDGFSDHVEFSEQNSSSIFALSMDKTSVDTEQTNFQLDFPTGFEGETVSLFWDMEGTYEEDQVSQTHTLYADDGTTVTRDNFALNIDVEGSTLNEVERPETENTVDLGSMEESELEQYFNEFGEQFTEWMGTNVPGMNQGF
ncbi:DUF6583 family protein [Lacicoccus qingdaonensis]|uniref:Uncharacterized protein n=1 Tax=Lacicoccus qingdaonensis TaxID=576118 RepID=A0A1G9GES7_9BACL|nr:DUF6583 family protein [Salinicoccus qingdaonensis]SDK99160.1 hypothetical protein SAMN05216216_1172 [Salinicoccus qingdaonensis]